MKALLAGQLLCAAACAAALVHPVRAEGAPMAIYVMNVDGSGARLLVRVEGYDQYAFPRWSHDGKRVVFDAQPANGGLHRIYLVNSDGSGLRDLGPGSMGCWSNDDKQLALYFLRGNGGAQLVVQNLDGNGRTELNAGKSPRWSPDGGLLAATDGNNISLTDLVTGETKLLFAEPYFEVFRGFSFSPDGKRLALAVRTARDSKRQLLLVNVEGAVRGTEMRLKSNLGGFVSFSPDGKRLIYSSDYKIYVIEVDGHGPSQLLPGQHGQNHNPDWSPDGKSIVFVSDRLG